MANVILAYPNKIDSATLSGGSWKVTLPITNLLDHVIRKVARTTDAALSSTKVVATFEASTTIGLWALVNHNLSAGAQIRIEGSQDSGFVTLSYDSGWEIVWPAIYETSALNWEDENWWSGAITAEQMAATVPVYVKYLGGTKYGRYWRISVSDTYNVAGYVQIGRLFASTAWQPAVNMSYGASIQWDIRANVEQSLGGTKYIQRLSSARSMRFSIDGMSASEAYAYALEMQRVSGLDREILVISDADDSLTLQQRSFLARLEKTTGVVAVSPSVYATQIELEEVL